MHARCRIGLRALARAKEMKRHIELGFEAAATATCAGIVLGLYRFGSSTASRSPTARRGESIGGDIAGASPARQDLMLDTKRWPFDDFSRCLKVR